MNYSEDTIRTFKQLGFQPRDYLPGQNLIYHVDGVLHCPAQVIEQSEDHGYRFKIKFVDFRGRTKEKDVDIIFLYECPDIYYDIKNLREFAMKFYRDLDCI